jgi:two-component system NtrC family response regulator
MSGMVTLVVEDEHAQREMLAAALEDMGFEAIPAAGAGTALEVLAGRPVDVVISDLRMPGATGMDLLRAARLRYPGAEVVLVTAYGTVEDAVEAMRAGAADFLGKPIDLERLESSLRRIAERRQEAREVRRLRVPADPTGGFRRFVGAGGRLQGILALAARAAPSAATVLVTGESGTGKELVANLLHENSPRSAGPFVKVNCAALPETLLEAELFGHSRGAFTGAVAARAGRFEEASGGTIFLDEIGELTLATQAKLLRVLQEREIIRLGENLPVPVDVRVIAATNRDLEAAVREKRFRDDLYYRIHVVALRLPPLRERMEDVPVLVDHFLGLYAGREGKAIRGLTREARDALLRYPYPGTVRELANIVERAVVLCRGDHLERGDLPDLIPPEPGPRDPLPGGTLPEALLDLERRMIEAAMRRHGGVVARAARELGVHERVLRYRIARLRRRPSEEPGTGDGAGA